MACAAKARRFCEECAADCEGLGDMKACEKECRQCADSCLKMAA